jgi:hypothetical protein
MTNITPHTLRGVPYAHLGIPRYVGHTIIHYFHRRAKLEPLKATPGSIALDAVRGVFKRGHRDATLAAPTDKRRKAPRPGSIATIGEIIAAKVA